MKLPPRLIMVNNENHYTAQVICTFLRCTLQKRPTTKIGRAKTCYIGGKWVGVGGIRGNKGQYTYHLLFSSSFLSLFLSLSLSFSLFFWHIIFLVGQMKGLDVPALIQSSAVVLYSSGRKKEKKRHDKVTKSVGVNPVFSSFIVQLRKKEREKKA